MRNCFRRQIQAIHRQQELFAPRLHGIQCAILSSANLFSRHKIGNLNKESPVVLIADKINLLLANTSDCHLIAAPNELRIHDVFKRDINIPCNRSANHRPAKP